MSQTTVLSHGKKINVNQTLFINNGIHVYLEITSIPLKNKETNLSVNHNLILYKTKACSG